MPMFERFSERAVRIIMASQEEAKKYSSGAVSTEHLLLAMLHEKEQIALKTFDHFKMSGSALKTRLEEYLSHQPPSHSKDVPFSAQLKRTIELAWDEARQLGHSYVGVEHLFLGLVKEGSGVIAAVLSEAGITYATAKTRIISLLGEETATQKKGKSQTATPVLDSFSRDLTVMAREKKLDPVVGRSKEIDRVVQILSRRKKNNPVLTGEAGVGKTAIVEGLA